MEWISERTALPPIGASVLLLVPRQAGDCWDLYAAWLAVEHEDVRPHPVAPGHRWPTDYWWNISKQRRDPILITGNAWWSAVEAIPLPPGAEHRYGDNGAHYFAQPVPIWRGQDRRDT